MFERWHDRLARQVEGWKKDERFSGLRGDKLVSALRAARVIPSDRLGIAIVGADVRELLGAREKVLQMSADTVVKQIIKREGQRVDLESYLGIQRVLDYAEVVKVTDDGNKAAYWRADGGEIWFCVVKVTAPGELFFVSYRQDNIKDLRKKLTASELEKLGVA